MVVRAYLGLKTSVLKQEKFFGAAKTIQNPLSKTALCLRPRRQARAGA